jgi:ACS family pantothenate transporter-like MFS transporter
MHKRQLRQEAQLEAELPPSEAARTSESETEKELDNKLAGAIEPVRGSVTIM